MSEPGAASTAPALDNTYLGGAIVAQRSSDPLDRFISKVAVDPRNGCWLWNAGRNREGYGKFKVEGRTRLAHRWGYERIVGPIPEGAQLDHLCRKRACVNPAHLEPVTCRENLLRGDTFQARNAAKTHCPQGHPYDGDNLMLSDGRRNCRTCKREQTARWRADNIERRRQLDREGARRRRRERAA